jgi:flagellar biosynthetic protein FlhB
LDEPIPEALYYAVAQVIAYVFSLNSLDRNASVADRPDPEVPFGMRYNTDGTLEK